jgi:hypothetical protein
MCDDDDEITLEEHCRGAEAAHKRAAKVLELAVAAEASARQRVEAVRKRQAGEGPPDEPPCKRARHARSPSPVTFAMLLMDAALADPDRLPPKMTLDSKQEAWYRSLVLQRLAACPRLSSHDFVKSKNMGAGPKDPTFVLYHGSAYFRCRLKAGTFFTNDPQAAERYCFKRCSDNTEAFVHRITTNQGDAVIDFGLEFNELKRFFRAENAAGIIRGLLRLDVLKELGKMGIRFLCISYQSMDEFVLVSPENCEGATKYIKWTSSSEEVDLQAMAAQQALEHPIHKANVRKANYAGVY